MSNEKITDGMRIIALPFARDIITEIDKQVSTNKYDIGTHNTMIMLSMSYAFSMMIIKQWHEAVTKMTFEEFVAFMLKETSEILKDYATNENKPRIIQ